MDNLMPPPNSSPEEIQAWNQMMDTMVTFIKASTHLMNTITQKVRVAPTGSSGPAVAANLNNLLAGCEPECIVCRPKPPCGICTNESEPPKRAPSTARTAPSLAKTAPSAAKAAPSAVKAASSAAKAAPSASRAASSTARGPPSAAQSSPDVPDSNEPAETPPISEQPAEEAASPQEGENAEEAEAAEKPEADSPDAGEGGAATEGGEAEPAAEGEGGEAAGNQGDQGEEAVAVNEVPAENKPVSAPTIDNLAGQPAGDTQNKCVCSAIRAQRLDQEKRKCGCPKKKSKEPIEPIQEEEPPKPPECGCPKNRSQVPIEPIQEEEPLKPPEIICECGPTAGNLAAQDAAQKAQMQEMVQKLANAQQEISQLQEEMARLQRMDTSRRIGPNGGPNPALLYREIMRDTQPFERSPQRSPASARQGGSAVGQPQCPAARPPPPTGRQRLLNSGNATQYTEYTLGPFSQNNGFPDATGSSRYTDFDASRIPGDGNITPNFRQPLNQTYNVGDPNPDQIERIECPASRVSPNANVRRRLFQTNTTGDLTSNTGFGNIEDANLDSRFTTQGCIPECEGGSNSLGTSQGLMPQTSTPLQSMTQVSRQRLMQQSLTQQAGRQGMMNRSASPPYSGGAAPCRRIPSIVVTSPGGGTAYQGLNSNYQDPSAPNPLLWSRGGQYGSMIAASPNINMSQYSSGRNASSPSRRIIMCGPSSAPEEDCDPSCSNLT